VLHSSTTPPPANVCARNDDSCTAVGAWIVEFVVEKLLDGFGSLVVDVTVAVLLARLDELNIALRYGYLDLATVVAALRERRPGLHVVVTGRNAKPELIEAADLVTEMTLVKHHFAAGVKAQPGIEF